MLLRPPIRVARPDDWTGALARLASWLVIAVALVVVVLVRLPDAWVAWAGGNPVIVRLALTVLVLLAISWARPFVYARLPRAASLIGRTLALPSRGGRCRVPLADVVHVDIELRPPPIDETVIVELRDGTVHEVCPLAWEGAPELYTALARKMIA